MIQEVCEAVFIGVMSLLVLSACNPLNVSRRDRRDNGQSDLTEEQKEARKRMSEAYRAWREKEPESREVKKTGSGRRQRRKPTTSIFGIDIYVKGKNYGRRPETDEHGLRVPRRLDYDSTGEYANDKARYRNKKRIEEGKDPDELERIPFDK
ncbi:MAG: hypothetical protein ACOCR1_03320 [Planctomycetota bacterium]